MNGDEQLLNGRVYGAEHDDPNPGPLPHRTYAELVGGPLDGLLLDIHGWWTEEVDDGRHRQLSGSDGTDGIQAVGSPVIRPGQVTRPTADAHNGCRPSAV